MTHVLWYNLIFTPLVQLKAININYKNVIVTTRLENIHLFPELLISGIVYQITEAVEGKERWGVKERVLMASAGAQAYNGGLDSFLLLAVHWKRQICHYSPCIADSVNHLNFQSNTDNGG